jgi:hypothetical protein
MADDHRERKFTQITQLEPNLFLLATDPGKPETMGDGLRLVSEITADSSIHHLIDIVLSRRSRNIRLIR